MKLSLVVSTLGRSAELGRLFDSLDAQTFRDFEVLVVDQNDDDRLAWIAEETRTFQLSRLHTPGQRGLSRGRNVGWRHCEGDFVLFPDDDCWYPPGLFAAAVAQIEARRLDLLAGRAADANGRNINGRFRATEQPITRGSVWSTQIEWMMFFRRRALELVGGYDEDLGIGSSSPWQSAEGQDISFRAMGLGLRCHYDPALVGHHAEMLLDRPDPATIHKGRIYARGMGFVLGRYGFGWPYITYWLARTIFNGLRAVLAGNSARVAYFIDQGRGRLEGWRAGLAERRAVGRRGAAAGSPAGSPTPSPVASGTAP
ncbi:MAG TPA: glycosyltransferase family A protein [Caulobacteraceae bacterium]